MEGGWRLGGRQGEERRNVGRSRELEAGRDGGGDREGRRNI